MVGPQHCALPHRHVRLNNSRSVWLDDSGALVGGVKSAASFIQPALWLGSFRAKVCGYSLTKLTFLVLANTDTFS